MSTISRITGWYTSFNEEIQSIPITSSYGDNFIQEPVKYFYWKGFVIALRRTFERKFQYSTIYGE